MDGAAYTWGYPLAGTMAAEPTHIDPPDRDPVACSACKHPITDPDPVAHCPTCGWQEMRGAD